MAALDLLDAHTVAVDDDVEVHGLPGLPGELVDHGQRDLADVGLGEEEGAEPEGREPDAVPRARRIARQEAAAYQDRDEPVHRCLGEANGAAELGDADLSPLAQEGEEDVQGPLRCAGGAPGGEGGRRALRFHDVEWGSTMDIRPPGGPLLRPTSAGRDPPWSARPAPCRRSRGRSPELS